MRGNTRLRGVRAIAVAVALTTSLVGCGGGGDAAAEEGHGEETAAESGHGEETAEAGHGEETTEASHGEESSASTESAETAGEAHESTPAVTTVAMGDEVHLGHALVTVSYVDDHADGAVRTAHPTAPAPTGAYVAVVWRAEADHPAVHDYAVTFGGANGVAYRDRSELSPEPANVRGDVVQGVAVFDVPAEAVPGGVVVVSEVFGTGAAGWTVPGGVTAAPAAPAADTEHAEDAEHEAESEESGGH